MLMAAVEADPMTEKMRKAQTGEEIDIQMTPMIDVTFLLLIFFMCSIKFKLLDGKICTYLPRDRGVNATAEMVPLENIEIDLQAAPRSVRGYTIYVNEKRVAGLRELHEQVRHYHACDPDASVTCRPGGRIRHGQVVEVVDECLRAGTMKITFNGVPLED